MVYGELGRFSLEIRVKLRMVSFWTKLVQSENKLSSNLYRLMLQIHDLNLVSCKFLIILVLAIFFQSIEYYYTFTETCLKRTLT